MRATVVVGIALALFVGFVAGRASAISGPAVTPALDEVATRGITRGKSQRAALCERYCTAVVPSDRPRHITIDLNAIKGGTAVPEGME